MKPSEKELEVDPQHLVDILPWPLFFYLFVFLLLPLLLPAAPVMLCCTGLCLTVCARNPGGGAGVQAKLSTSACSGQINCVKVCKATCAFIMSYFSAVVFVQGCYHALLFLLQLFQALKGELNCFWQTIHPRMEQKCSQLSKDTIKERILKRPHMAIPHIHRLIATNLIAYKAEAAC